MTNLATDGYQVLHNIISTDEIVGMRDAITETMDRVAHSLRVPFEMSCFALGLEDRLGSVWRKDRTYAQALFRAVLADSHRDERINIMTCHPQLTSEIAELIAPLKRTGQTIRVRASTFAFSEAHTRWHQDVVKPSNIGCGTVRLACWIPLIDVDDKSGALEVMPGVWQGPLPHQGEPDGRFFIAPENLPVGERRTIPVRMGDVLVLDRFIPHRSLQVSRSLSRWSVVMWVKASPNDAG